MAAPKFAPVSPLDDPRSYESPAHVPDQWLPVRPAEIRGFQPEGGRMGYQGPDQGYAIKIANTFRPKIHVGAGESIDDAVQGCLVIGLRRASLHSRAPVVHDLTIAFTIWGYLDGDPPVELIGLRKDLFAGVANVTHHYDEARLLADMIPEATLRLTPQAAVAAYPTRWRELVGVPSA